MSTMELFVFKKFWDEIDTIHSLPEQDCLIAQKVHDLINRLKEINPDQNIDKSEWYCLFGYLGYHFNDYLYDKIDILQHFNNAIKYKSDNTIALLYCGYYYFDNHEWQLSLDAFNSISKDSFEVFVLPLKLKILELKLCCKIQLDKSCFLPKEFYQYLHDLNSINSEDKNNFSELYNTIEGSVYLYPNIQEEAINMLEAGCACPILKRP